MAEPPDVLGAALRTALGPHKGMQRVPFPIESYAHRSLPISDKKLLNFMAEAQPSDARSPWALIPTPGLTGFFIAGTGAIHAVNSDLPGVIYLVSGLEAYRFTPADDVLTFLGDVGEPTVPSGFTNYGLITIAVGPTAAVFCIPPYAWATDHVGGLVQIVTLPAGGVSSVAYLDGYFVFTNQAIPSQFCVSGLLDPLHVDALDFASLDAFPNAALRVMTLGTDLWFAGSEGWEIWYDAGFADFPFRRQAGGVLQRAPSSPVAIALGDLSLWWVSVDGIVYRSAGYQAVRVSTTAVEEILRETGSGSPQSMFTYSQGGHIFCVVNLPHRTVVYDTLTQKWHERASSSDGTGRWRVDNSCANLSIPLLGDTLSGTVFFADQSVDSDAGLQVQRQIIFPPIWAATYRAFMNRLEIEMETGSPNSPGDMLLEWSDDGGWNFTGLRTVNAGARRDQRVVTTRLGSFRQRVFRLTLHGRTTLYAMDADITAPLLGG